MDLRPTAQNLKKERLRLNQQVREAELQIKIWQKTLIYRSKELELFMLRFPQALKK